MSRPPITEKLIKYRQVSYFHRNKIAISQLEGMTLHKVVDFSQTKLDRILRDLRELDVQLTFEVAKQQQQ